MAEPLDNPNAKRIMDKVFREAGEPVDEEQTPKKPGPMYAVQYESRIPVSKSMGKLWKSRWESAVRLRNKRQDDRAWSEAVAYFRNDQTPGRGTTSSGAAGDRYGREGKRSDRETENIIFANATALVPSIYAKTPTIEITAVDTADEPIVQCYERLINQLLSMTAAPGIGIKSKARRCVLSAVLKNSSYIEIGYTMREHGSEQAIAELQKLGDELRKGGTAKEIEATEGKIMAVEKRVDFLTPAGPWAKFRRPEDVVRDPDSIEEDLSDARWVMIHEYMPTEFLNAQYTTKVNGEHRLIAQPTHVIGRGTGAEGQNDAEWDAANFTLITDTTAEAWKKHGYDDNESYLRAQRTSVWHVWDKVTRRCLIFAENDWTWPIWVWDDPYHLDRFFPIYAMSFYQDPEHGEARGEVVYYLDQQDGINEINREMRKARAWARRNIFFNTNVVTQNQADAYLAGDKDHAVGIDLPEGQKLMDHVYSQPPPSTTFLQLFDKKPLLEAADRVSSVMPVMRGVEFRTNTTNKAVETYNSNQQTRLDEKVDAVEDLIGNVSWGVLQMCVMHMKPEDVVAIIGEVNAQPWQNMPPRELRKMVQMRIVGGSTEKPTSRAKKEMALELGQVLGQFASASPAVVLVVLKAMQRAFNEVIITDEDWQLIMQSIQSSMQQPQEGAPQEGGAPPQPGAEGGGIEQMLAQLPPEAQQAVQQSIAQGVPPEQAVQQVMQLLQQQGAAQ